MIQFFLILTIYMQDFFLKIFEMSKNEKPHLIQYLMFHIIPIWVTYPNLSLHFFPIFPYLLTYKETKTDQKSIPEVLEHFKTNNLIYFTDKTDELKINEEIIEVSPQGTIVTRFLLLYFIENICSKNSSELFSNCFNSALLNLLNDLLSHLSRKEKCIPCVIGSELFREKLRIWQALCIMSRFLTEDIIKNITPILFNLITLVTPHAIRVHMEIFFGIVLVKARRFVLPQILSKLNEFNHHPQVLASYFVIIGHLLGSCGLIDDNKGDIFTVEKSILSIDEIEPLLVTLVPLFTCGPGLPRCVAQLLAHTIIPVHYFILLFLYF